MEKKSSNSLNDAEAFSCWKCGAGVPLTDRRVAFSSTCDQCHSWQHCCRNCRHYAPGKPNHCLVPDTELVKDRENRNFCDEFALKDPDSRLESGSDEQSVRQKKLEDTTKRLFGEGESIPDSKAFDDLFGE